MLHVAYPFVVSFHTNITCTCYHRALAEDLTAALLPHAMTYLRPPPACPRTQAHASSAPGPKGQPRYLPTSYAVVYSRPTP